MNISEHVLPEHRKLARALHESNQQCMTMAWFHLKQGNYQAADKWLLDYRKGAVELAELTEKKYKYDRELRQFKKTVEELIGQGIDILIVRRAKYETSN